MKETIKDIATEIDLTKDAGEETADPGKKVNIWKLLLKIGLTFVAFFIVWLMTDFQKLWEIVSHANFLILAAAILVYQVSQWFSSFRLLQVLHQAQIHIQAKTNLLLYFVGMFYNLFFPGGVGGDGYKVHLFKKYLQIPIKTSVRSVLYDRISGLSALCFLILIAASLLVEEYRVYTLAALPLVWIGFYLFTRIVFKRFTPVVWKVSGFSLIIQSIQLTCAYLILLAIGVEENQMAFLLVFMISAIISVLPISVGGAGVREASIAYMFQLMGMDSQQETAVALSLIFLGISIINAIPGIFVSERKLFRDALAAQPA